MAGTHLGGFAGGGESSLGLTATYQSGGGSAKGQASGGTTPKGQSGSTAGGISSFLNSLTGGGGSSQGTSTAANLFNTAIGLGTGIASSFGVGNFGGKPAGTIANNPAGSYFGGGSMSSWGPPQTPAASPPPAPPAPPAPQAETPMYYGPPAAPSTPWYGKWWVWASVIGGLAVLGTGSYFLLRERPAKAAAGLGEIGCANPNPRYRRLYRSGR
jgi:hypothetical protein